MLSVNVSETPRPRPPAKVRRSTDALLKEGSTPPPAYVAPFTLTPEYKPSLDTLLGSPLSATLQRVGWTNGINGQLSPAANEDRGWMNEKSREELSELLIKAEDLIKERENGLGIASAVCKTLYDNTVALKSKHQALLMRLPPPSSSSSPSPSPSPEVMSRMSSHYNISISRPVSEYGSPPLPYRSQTRKISVSTSEISHLAEQNAELLDKLERMEVESNQADQSGRRELKRLEKEIMNLREELEKTQAKSEELEEKAKTGFGWDTEKVVQEVWKKREERDARLRAMRNISRGSMMNVEGESDIRDFAPEGSAFGGPSSTFSFFPSGQTTGSPLTHPSLPPGPSDSPPESSLIAQLLEKIQELEETNTRIIEQQTETTNQLNSMQRETEQIAKIYECLTEENVIELAPDVDPENGGERSPYDEIIRFRSLQRTLGTLLPVSPKRGEAQESSNFSAIPRTRKSVMGLFDDEHSQGAITPEHYRPSNLPSGHLTSRSIRSTGLVSPSFSSRSISPSRSNLSNHPRTLETELGNEFSEGWGLNPDNHHLRVSSLYDLAQISAPSSPSPSQMSHRRSQSQERSILPTPTSMGNPALRLSVEPPTPDKVSTTDQAEGGSAGQQSIRFHRMSETIRSRTSRWVVGRFDTLTRADNPDIDAREASRPLTPLSLHLRSAFDAAALNVKGEEASSYDDQNKADLQVQRKEDEKNFALKLWLWLQFVVVILVFIWTMTKRGPESVLGKRGQRRVASSMR